MFILDDFSKQCSESKLSPLRVQLLEASHQAFSVNNGNIPRWEKAIESIKGQPQEVAHVKVIVLIQSIVLKNRQV